MTFDNIHEKMTEKPMTTVAYEYNGETIELNVKPWLGFADAMKMVQRIVDGCTMEANGLYTPEAFDFVVKACTLIGYAGLEEGESIDAMYDVVYGTDIYNAVLGVIDRDQHSVLVGAAKEKIDHVCRSMLNANTRSLNELISKMDAVMDEGSRLTEQLSSEDMSRALGDLMRMSGVIDGGNSDNVVEFKP